MVISAAFAEPASGRRNSGGSSSSSSSGGGGGSSIAAAVVEVAVAAVAVAVVVGTDVQDIMVDKADKELLVEGSTVKKPNATPPCAM